jgi:RecQ family ATP-dependent DNA helicase
LICKTTFISSGFEESFGFESLYDAFFEYTATQRLDRDSLQCTSEEVSKFLAWLYRDENIDDSIADEEDDPIDDSGFERGVGFVGQPSASVPSQQQQSTIRNYFGANADDGSKTLKTEYEAIEKQGFDDAGDILNYANAYVFGNKCFRTKQRQIIESCMRGRDVFVLMPTGGGKSLCYQLPAVISRGLTVVITPLLSLMQDQVQALCRLPSGGVPATYISSQQTPKELNAVYAELEKGQPSMKLLFVTPEQFVSSEKLQTKLKVLHGKNMLARLVIDECHCVSQWGHDFRPEYSRIGLVKARNFPRLSVTALTATATASVRSDVIKSLKMQSWDSYVVSFYRENLIMRVIPKDYNKDGDWDMPAWEVRILQYVQGKKNESGIVYCLSREDCEMMACMLNDAAGVPSAHYHAGMTPGQRTAVQNKWRSGEIKVVAATIAFGMGIDHPNVRYVIHATISKSLEGYYQEAGRCGRDGAPGECILFYGKRDVPRILNLLRRGKRTANFQSQLALLNSVTEYCCQNSICRHAQLLKYLGEEWDREACNHSCDVCKNEVLHLTETEKLKRTAGTKASAIDPPGKKKSKPIYSGFTTALSLSKSRPADKGLKQFTGFTSALSLSKK